MPLPPFVFIAVFIRKGVKWWYTLAAKAQDNLNERGVYFPSVNTTMNHFSIHGSVVTQRKFYYVDSIFLLRLNMFQRELRQFIFRESFPRLGGMLSFTRQLWPLASINRQRNKYLLVVRIPLLSIAPTEQK